MTSTVLVAGARTPMGRFNGSLAAVPATELGGVAIRGAVERSTLAASQIDYVIMGQVLQAGCGQIPARQAAVAAGIAMDVPAVTINKVCLSGLHAIALADQLIRSGEFGTVVAGGMESMTRAPHLLPPGTRSGLPYGDFTVHDHLAYDGLHDIFTDLAMGVLTEQPMTSHPSAGSIRTVTRPSRTSGRPRRRGRGSSSRRSSRSSSGSPRRHGHRRRRRHSGRDDRRGTRQAPSRVPYRRHHHRRLRIADFRRRSRSRGDEPRRGRGAGARLARRDHRARHGRRAGLDVAGQARSGHSGRVPQGGDRPGGARPGRDQRGVLRGRASSCGPWASTRAS